MVSIAKDGLRCHSPFRDLACKCRARKHQPVHAEGTAALQAQLVYQVCDRLPLAHPSGPLHPQVGMFPRVKASGVGHSWFKEMFCEAGGVDT